VGEFTGLRTSDAKCYLWYFIERSDSVATETKRFALKFSGSWPLPMGALMSHVLQHFLMTENSYGTILLRYFSACDLLIT